MQPEPVDRVLLHDPHDPGREVRAQLAEPPRHRRRRRAQPAALLAVHGLQRRVDRPVLRARAARPCRRPRPRRARAATAATARQPPSNLADRARAPAPAARSAIVVIAVTLRGLSPSGSRRRSPRRRRSPAGRTEKARRSSGRTLVKASGVHGGDPAVEDREQVGVVDEDEPGGADEALDPGRAALGLLARARARGTSAAAGSSLARVVAAAGWRGRRAMPGSRSPVATRRSASRHARVSVSSCEQRERAVDAVDERRPASRRSPRRRRRPRPAGRPRLRSDDPAQHARRPRSCRCRARRRSAGCPASGGTAPIRSAVSRSSAARSASALQHVVERVRQVGEQDRVGQARPARRRSPARRLARAFARPPRPATVVPQRPAWIRSSASSGCHSSRNASLNVPRAPRHVRGVPPRHLEQVEPVQQPACARGRSRGAGRA